MTVRGRTRTRARAERSSGGPGGAGGGALQGPRPSAGTPARTPDAGSDDLPPWLPPTVRGQVVAGAGRRLTALADLTLDARRIQDEIRAQVAALRGQGVSWQVIGLALGVTGEGARSRYSQQPTKGKRPPVSRR